MAFWKALDVGRTPVGTDVSLAPLSVVLLLRGLSLLHYAGVVFSARPIAWISAVDKCIRTGGQKDGRPVGDQPALLDVISNVFIPIIFCVLLFWFKHSPVHVENVEFGRSANAITPSRYVIVVLQTRLAADMQHGGLSCQTP